jgi:hypothetical protein
VLIETSELWDFSIFAADGEIGRIRDLQVDDRRWAVSDFVVSVGHWLTDRLVILPPASVLETEVRRRAIRVTLTTDAVAATPSVTTHPSVSRQRSVPPYQYLGLPLLVGELAPWNPALAIAGVGEGDASNLPQFDLHLRSLRDLGHYGVEAGAAVVGHVEDWLVDTHGWHVAYAVARITGGASRKHVLLPVSRLGPISWGGRAVHADLPRDAIIHAPDYEAGRPPDADYEARLRGWYRPST